MRPKGYEFGFNSDDKNLDVAVTALIPASEEAGESGAMKEVGILVKWWDYHPTDAGIWLRARNVPNVGGKFIPWRFVLGIDCLIPDSERPHPGYM